MNEEILVTVWCLTYNHAPYIGMALDSFINQKTDFKYEILVHDDKSTDGTTEILKEYEQRFPELVRVFYEEENLHSKRTLVDKMYSIIENEARGRYIATCEGDDCWVDYNKLQIQLDYMLKHPGCSMSGHNFLTWDRRNDRVVPWYALNGDQDLKTIDIIEDRGDGMHINTLVFFKEVYLKHLSILGDSSIGDKPLRMVASVYGEVHYFDRVMSIYRKYNPGGWSTRAYAENSSTRVRYQMTFARYLERFDVFTDYKFHDSVEIQRNASLNNLVSLTRKMSVEAFTKLCQSVSVKNEDYVDMIEELKVLKEQYHLEEKKIIDFSRQQDKLYIMGAGAYAERLFLQLEEYKIDIDGFVVSNAQQIVGDLYQKKVYHLCEVSNQKDNIGIIIGIKKNLQKEIEKSLLINDITNYMWPML